MTEKSKIIIVDKNDNIIGHKERGTLKKDDIYRVSALWITNSKNEVLLAKRHHTKSHHPRKWGPAVAGTVDEGETYEDNIIKEAEEEIGLEGITFNPGPKVETDNEYHHFTQWYTLNIDMDIDGFRIQEDEIEEIRWFPLKELERLLQKHPEDFLPTMKRYFVLFHQTEITIDNHPYHPLKGRLWLHDNPIAGIVITHSWRNSMDEPVCADAARYFFNMGYSVLQFNLPGHAKDDPLRNLSFTSAIQAVTKAAGYLKKRSHAKKIFSLGISLGTAAIGFNQENLFTATALLSYAPLVNPKMLYERYKANIDNQLEDIKARGYAIMNSASGRGTFEMGKEWIDEMKNDSAEYSRIFTENRTPAIMIQGTDDEFYDEKMYKDFLKKAGKESYMIDGADHNFSSGTHRKEIMKRIETFFNGFL